jgi:hypothetical protein
MLTGVMSKVLILFPALFFGYSLGFAPHHNNVKWPTQIQQRSIKLHVVEDISQLEDPEMQSYADYSE